jgi:FAD/FMN-containing dehydrogenase
MAHSHNSTGLGELRAALDGRLILPGDAGYDSARTVFYGKFNHRRPDAIVRAATAADVARVVTLAYRAGMPLAVRGGGHSLAGHSLPEGGLLLDLAGLKALDIDRAGRTAWAEAGLTAGEYTTAVGAHGLATGFGDTATVGIGGLTLGGGIGFLARKHGLTIDNLLAAEVVTADGQSLRADAQSHPDLFWALRGGGGNFGVVTRFHYRLHPVEAVAGGMLILPATPETILGFIAAAGAAPDELTAIANITIAPPMPFLPAEAHGKPIIMALVCALGPDGQRLLAPLRALATPLADMLRLMPYPELFSLIPDEPGPPQEVARTLFLDDFHLGTARTVLDHLRAGSAPLAVAQLRVLGGAVARVPVEATAYAHRPRRIMAVLGAVYEDPADTPTHDAWASAFAAALSAGQPGAYVNFLGVDAPGHVRAAYPGPTWDRLRAIKARYDPDNVFRLNHNIPPAGAG